MLQDESKMVHRPWSPSRRLLAGLFLLGTALGVALLRGPARADDNKNLADTTQPAGSSDIEPGKAAATPFDLSYVSDETNGIIAFRPAATFRHAGMSRYPALIREVYEVVFDDFAKYLKIDRAAQGRLSLALGEIDWVISGIGMGRSKGASKPHQMHRIEFSSLRVRTTTPFDWPRFLHESRIEFIAIQEPHGTTYYKITGEMKRMLGADPCSICRIAAPSCSTKKPRSRNCFAARSRPFQLTSPATDWERLSHGILAVAINNQNGAFAKSYDLGRPDDAIVLSLFKGVDHWILGVDDTDSIVLHATAACNGDTSDQIARSAESLVKIAREALEHREKLETPDHPSKRVLDLAKKVLTNVHVGHDDHSIDIRADGFGTLAAFSSLVESELKRQNQRPRRVRRQLKPLAAERNSPRPRNGNSCDRMGRRSPSRHSHDSASPGSASNSSISPSFLSTAIWSAKRA